MPGLAGLQQPQACSDMARTLTCTKGSTNAFLSAASSSMRLRPGRGLSAPLAVNTCGTRSGSSSMRSSDIHCRVRSLLPLS